MFQIFQLSMFGYSLPSWVCHSTGVCIVKRVTQGTTRFRRKLLIGPRTPEDQEKEERKHERFQSSKVWRVGEVRGKSQDQG